MNPFFNLHSEWTQPIPQGKTKQRSALNLPVSWQTFFTKSRGKTTAILLLKA